jgi:hypothetical protein
MSAVAHALLFTFCQLSHMSYGQLLLVHIVYYGHQLLGGAIFIIGLVLSVRFLLFFQLLRARSFVSF